MYWWTRLTIWCTITILIIQLVQYLVIILQSINRRFLKSTKFFPIIFFQLDHNSIPIELIRTLMMALSTFIMITLFSELGDTISNQFNLYSYELNQCNWNSFPLEVQRMFGVFVSNVQQSEYIRGYGNELCARVTAKEVNYQSQTLTMNPNEWATESVLVFQTLCNSFYYFVMLHQIKKFN